MVDLCEVFCCEVLVYDVLECFDEFWMGVVVVDVVCVFLYVDC